MNEDDDDDVCILLVYTDTIKNMGSACYTWWQVTVWYTCVLSRIMRESHACGSKIVISHIQTNFSRLTDNNETV